MTKKTTVGLGLALCSALFACAVEDGDFADEGIGQHSQPAITPVPDLEGLPGYYVRVASFAAPLGELKSMWLRGDAHEGEYTRRVAAWCMPMGCDVEIGWYWAVPNNPVMGFAFIGFYDEDEESQDYYIIDLALRDALGRISTMQLRKVYEEYVVTPFAVQRIW